MLMQCPEQLNCITDEVTEIPLCFSISIQSETACVDAFLAFTEPASLIAPPYNRNFSVNVVLPASGCEMMAKVRRREISGFIYTVAVVETNGQNLSLE